MALFPSYAFVLIEWQWHAARWAPGVTRLIQNGGEEPARVPDRIIDELRSRERCGLVELPPPPPSPRFRPGDKVCVTTGPLTGFPGLVSTMRPRQRVEVLLQMLGGLQRVELAAVAVERLA